MTIGIAAFITFRQSDYSTIVEQYQNYWPSQTVDQHTFYPFICSAIVSDSSGGQQSISVSFATSQVITDLVEAGLANAYFADLTFYRFTATADGTPPTSKTIIANYIGETISASQDETTITVAIGSSLSAVEAQAPPRKFTTTLIGEPPKL